MENILINFTADPSGLQPGIDGLEQLGAVDKEVADQAKKTADAMDKRDKAIADGTAKSTSQVEKLSTSFKNLDKSIVGGTYTKSLQQLQTQIAGTTDEFKALQLAIDFSKKKMEDLDPNSEEWKALNEQISQGEQLLQAFGEGAGQVETKTTTMKARLRELKNELQVLEDQGLNNTAEFEKMAIEASRLEDQISDTNARIKAMASDTFKFDAIISGLTGITAGFSAAQGASALLGDQSEDLQKALLKVNAAMAILQGLQQVQAVLQKQSAISIAVENAQRKIGAISTNLQTAAESENIVVKWLAVAAQKALNIVMEASPAGILLGAISAVAAALVFFSGTTETATDKQIKFNEQLKDEIDYLKQMNDLLNQPDNDRIAQLNNELTLMKSKRTSQDDILRKEKELADAEAAKASKTQGYYSNEIANIGENSAKLESLGDKLKTLQTELRTDGNDNWFKRKIFGSRSADDIKKDIDDIKGQIDNTKSLVDIGIQAQNEVNTATASQQAKAAEIEKKAFEDSLKSAKGYAEARVLIAAQGSREELNARLADIAAGARQELANVNLTEGERAKIIANSQRQEAQLQFDFSQRAQQETIKALEARAGLEKEGSRSRLNLELAALDDQKKAELQTSINGVKIKDLTEKQKQEIEDRYLKLSSDKIKEYAKSDAEAEINARIAAKNGDIAKLSIQTDAATNTKLLELKQKLVDDQAHLEIIGINESEHNEETRRAKVKAVYDKALADKQKLEQDKNRAEISDSLNNVSGFYDNQIAKAQLVLQNDLASFSARKKAREDYYKFSEAKIDAEKTANQQMYDAGLEDVQEYLNKKESLEIAQDQLDLQREQEKQQIKQQIVQAAFGILQQASDAMFAAQDQQRQADLNRQLQALQKRKDAELANKDLTEAQKAQIDKKYALQEAQIKTEGAKKDKEAKRQQALMNGFLAVTNALATVHPFIPNALIAAGVAAASAAIQVASINSTPIPQFAKGTKNAPAGFKWVGEKGPELIYDRGGYPILPAHTSRKLADSGFFDPEIMKAYNIPIPKNMARVDMPQFTTPDTTEHAGIDYELLTDMLASKLGNEIKGIPQTKLSFDENGFKASVMKGADEMIYLNKKLEL